MSNQIFIEDVQEGDQLPDLVKNPDTKQLVMYAGASQDFVAIHYDKDVAAEAGHPSVIVHGALKSAWLGELVTSWMGDDGRLLELDVSYRAIDYPGRTATCKGKIVGVSSDEQTVELEIGLYNDEDQVTTPGRALVSLPSKDSNK
ncbi:MAG: MaoC/PaaZ C-terminal domain-containing protein [Dehalococcoidia bacterium]|jgi:acyl dehydratase